MAQQNASAIPLMARLFVQAPHFEELKSDEFERRREQVLQL
jgi:hypothetical protein